MPQEQFLDDEPGLDRLAETDVIGEEQVGAGRAESTAERFELVRLDVHARPERRLVAVGVGTSDSSPAHRVDEASEGLRVIESVGVDGVGKALRRGDGVTDFEFPHDASCSPRRSFIQRLEVDDMVELGNRLVGRAPRKALGLDIGDGPRRATNLDDLTGFGKAGHTDGRHLHVLSSRQSVIHPCHVLDIIHIHSRKTPIPAGPGWSRWPARTPGCTGGT